MSTHTAPTIVRNGISKVLTEQTFGKKSPHVGKKFFAPTVTQETFQTDVEWISFDNVRSMLDKALRVIFAGIHLDHFNAETGLVNMDAWAIDAADFTAGVDKLSDLDDELDGLQAQQQSYALDDQFGEVDASGQKTERALELEKLIKETADKIRPIRIKRDDLRIKWAERAAKREAKKAVVAKEAVAA
jgi:hypothetical protein